MAMDVRRAVVIALHRNEAIRMQFRLLPLPAVVLGAGQSLERGSLHCLEAFAARDAKATMPLVIDPLDAYRERSIDLGDGGKSCVTKAEAKIAAEDLYEPLDDRLVLRFSDTRRDDGR